MLIIEIKDSYQIIPTMDQISLYKNYPSASLAYYLFYTANGSKLLYTQLNKGGARKDFF